MCLHDVLAVARVLLRSCARPMYDMSITMRRESRAHERLHLREREREVERARVQTLLPFGRRKELVLRGIILAVYAVVPAMCSLRACIGTSPQLAPPTRAHAGDEHLLTKKSQ